MKNEIGEGNGCPYIQACASYAKQIAANTNSTIENGLNPAFIIYIAGPYLGVAGAVFGNDFTMEPLTSMLPLLYLKNAPEMMMVTVHTLVALKLALKELEDYYSTSQVIQISVILIFNGQLPFLILAHSRHLITGMLSLFTGINCIRTNCF